MDTIELISFIVIVFFSILALLFNYNLKDRCNDNNNDSKKI